MLWSPWELGALPSKARPLFWGRTELHLSGGVSPGKSRQPGHCNHRNLLCNQTPVISKATSPRSPAIQLTQVSGGADLPAIAMLVPLFLFSFILSNSSLGDCLGPGTVCHTPSTTCNTLPTAPSTAGFSNLHWHRKLGLFCYYFVYLFSLRRRQRNKISLQQDVGFCEIVLIGASWG